jgi:hypothetical protein
MQELRMHRSGQLIVNHAYAVSVKDSAANRMVQVNVD